MKIGELSLATGTSVETIRFYEREGLLPVPARSSGNYRIYGEDHAARLAFIRHCRSLDMALDEVRVLLRFKDAPRDDCGEVNRVLDEHIDRVAHRIGELKALEQQLRTLRGQCQAPRGSGSCGILEGLSQAAVHQGDAAANTGHGHAHHVARSHGRH